MLRNYNYYNNYYCSYFSHRLLMFKDNTRTPDVNNNAYEQPAWTYECSGRIRGQAGFTEEMMRGHRMRTASAHAQPAVEFTASIDTSCPVSYSSPLDRERRSEPCSSRDRLSYGGVSGMSSGSVTDNKTHSASNSSISREGRTNSTSSSSFTRKECTYTPPFSDRSRYNSSLTDDTATDTASYETSELSDEASHRRRQESSSSSYSRQDRSSSSYSRQGRSSSSYSRQESSSSRCYSRLGSSTSNSTSCEDVRSAPLSAFSMSRAGHMDRQLNDVVGDQRGQTTRSSRSEVSQ